MEQMRFCEVVRCMSDRELISYLFNLYIYLVCLPLDTSVPVGRIFLVIDFEKLVHLPTFVQLFLRNLWFRVTSDPGQNFIYL
jgi:hypothetical protein